MTVLDMFSGGGYYTEMIAFVVGEKGKVVAHSNQAYAQFAVTSRTCAMPKGDSQTSK